MASRCFNKPVWKDGKLAGEGYFVNHIPPLAVEKAGGWEPLLKRGEQQFNVHCAVCHGASGRGGGGEVAFGIVGAYGLAVAPVEHHSRRTSQARPDGQFFHTITNGVRHDAGLRPPGEGPGPLGDRRVPARAAVRRAGSRRK